MGNPAPTPSAATSAHAVATSAHAVPSWRHTAACADPEVDPEIFFPEGTTGPAERQAAEARTVCAGCPVRTPCLREGLVEPDGVRV
ncbi:WhiB family transcriptional regulator, partial [Candidatus Frankia alpina]|uniref:WhiB family transcriptional regulator n=1 Tax=Candidatus Frankia alpina TaxID=2699483 RepID=UPI0013D21DDC